MIAQTNFVFFGNGPVAAESLNQLCSQLGKDCVELVVTKRRPKHHKENPPLELVAKDIGLRLEYADTKKELDELLLKLKPKSKHGLVIDFGVIISKQTIGYFPKGILNSHFSLLPHWRGADPITYSILSGQKKTGVSLMLIDTKLDTGALLATTELELDGTETNESLTQTLIASSTQLLTEMLPLYANDSIVPYEQFNSVVTYSRKLSKEDGQLNLNKTATELEREIRAFNTWPKTRFELNGIQIIITGANVVNHPLSTAEVKVTNKTIYIGCKVGTLEITKLKPAGKNEMSVEAFINGYSGKLFSSTQH